MNQVKPAFNADKYLDCAQTICDKILQHPMVKDHPEMEGRTGCCVYVASLDHPDRSLAWRKVGQVEEGKSAQYFDLSREKAVRLARHPQLDLSYQCRDEANNQWGGAIRGTYYLHSVAGWPQDLNEMHALMTAVKYGDVQMRDARDLLRQREAGKVVLEDGKEVPLVRNTFADIIYELNWS